MTARSKATVRISRALTWAWFVSIAVTGAVFALAGSATPAGTVMNDVLTYEIPMVVALVVSGVLAYRTKGSTESLFWMHISIATALLFVAEAYWTWYTYAVDPKGPASDNAVVALYFVSGIAFLSVVFTMTRFGLQPLLERARFVLDIAAGFLALFPILYIGWTLPMLGDVPGGGWQTATLAAMYPLFGAMLLGATLSVFVGWKAHRWSGWERLVTAAFVLVAFAVVTWPVWYADHLLPGGTGLSRYVSLLGLGFALLCVAMAYRITEPPVDASSELWPVLRPENTYIARAYPVVLVSALPALGLVAFEIGGRDRGFPVALSATLLAIVLVARSATIAFEQAGNLQKAFIDPATGVLNRTWLDTMLRRKLSEAREAESVLSVAVYDVADEDRFNAVVGHSAGEAALARVAGVLFEETASRGEVFSLSSYEFVVILPGVEATDAAVWARRTWLRLRREALVGGRPLDIAAGVAAYPSHADDAASLVSAAETALGAARGSEAEPVIIYGEHLNTLDEADVQLRARMRAIRSTIRMLAEAVDARDTFTRDHSANVSDLATALAQVMDLEEDEIQVVGLAALVHDVGKVGVHDEILLKGGYLTSQERAEVESHSVLGERILAPARIDEILPIVRSHHERWDGAGYPDGLAGEDIPLGARILAVCDAYEAMIAGRSYQLAVDRTGALEEISRGSGSQFDPAVAATFARMVMQLEATHSEQTLGLRRAGFDSAVR